MPSKSQTEFPILIFVSHTQAPLLMGICLPQVVMHSSLKKTFSPMDAIRCL